MPRFRACYETLPSLRDSDQISHLTQHSAYGSVLGYDIACLRHAEFRDFCSTAEKAERVS